MVRFRRMQARSETPRQVLTPVPFKFQVNYGRGIAAETKQYYQEKREAQAAAASASDADITGQVERNEADEDDWELDDTLEEDDLDEAKEQPPAYDTSQGDALLQYSTSGEMAKFENAHAEAFQVRGDVEKELPYPVILPQRI